MILDDVFVPLPLTPQGLPAAAGEIVDTWLQDAAPLTPAASRTYPVHNCVIEFFKKVFTHSQNFSKLTIKCHTKSLRDRVNAAIMRLCPIETATSVENKTGHWIDLCKAKIIIYCNTLQALAQRIDQVFSNTETTSYCKVHFLTYATPPPEWCLPDLPYGRKLFIPSNMKKVVDCVQLAFQRLFDMGVGKKEDGIHVKEVHWIFEDINMFFWVKQTIQNGFLLPATTKHHISFFELIFDSQCLSQMAQKTGNEFSKSLQIPPIDYHLNFRTLLDAQILEELSLSENRAQAATSPAAAGLYSLPQDAVLPAAAGLYPLPQSVVEMPPPATKRKADLPLEKEANRDLRYHLEKGFRASKGRGAKK